MVNTMQNMRLTVALDLTELDARVLEYTSFVCRSLPISKIYFLHVEEKLDLPISLLKARPELAEAPVDESLEAQMKKEVQQHLKLDQDIEMDFDVVQGQVFETVVQHIKIKQPDLLIVGKRKPDGHHELPSVKLARHTTCSVFFVPESFSLDIQNILVPVDFSEHATLATEMAMNLSTVLEGDKIHLLNIYNVPEGYQRLGETYEQANEVMVNYAKKDCQDFVANLENAVLESLQFHFTDQSNRPREQIITEYLKDLNCQLLVMGSKGRTNLAALFMGSLAEKLIRADLGGVPLLLVKKKHENLGFLNALLQISKA